MCVAVNQSFTDIDEDVKRIQTPEAENKAMARTTRRRSRPRPVVQGRGQDEVKGRTIVKVATMS